MKDYEIYEMERQQGQQDRIDLWLYVLGGIWLVSVAGIMVLAWMLA